jgi:hypothetical protein
MTGGAGCAECKHLIKENIHEGAQSEIKYLQLMDMINMRETQTAVFLGRGCRVKILDIRGRKREAVGGNSVMRSLTMCIPRQIGHDGVDKRGKWLSRDRWEMHRN